MPLIDPKKRITVGPDENGNCFYLRAKMDIATRTAVVAEFARLSRGIGYVPDAIYDLTLLRHNLLAWSGPDFVDEKGQAIPCNWASIGRLDPADPLYRPALAAIGEANPTGASTGSATGDEDEAAAVHAEASADPKG